MKLIDVYNDNRAYQTLYDLLKEREPHESISHKQMPAFDKHCDFVDSRPYLHWYLIGVSSEIVGAVYLTRQREIGIGILKRFRRRHYAHDALRILMSLHPGEFLANINPDNHTSLHLFQSLQFEPLQITLRRA